MNKCFVEYKISSAIWSCVNNFKSHAVRDCKSNSCCIAIGVRGGGGEFVNFTFYILRDRASLPTRLVCRRASRKFSRNSGAWASRLYKSRSSILKTGALRVLQIEPDSLLPARRRRRRRRRFPLRFTLLACRRTASTSCRVECRARRRPSSSTSSPPPSRVRV